MDKRDFEERYSFNSGLVISDKNTVKEWLHDFGLKAVRCDCGEEGCRGWQMIHIASAAAAKKYFGEFARLNFQEEV